MKPNFIQGMKTRGHLRANKDKHYQKQAAEYLRQQVKELKERREALQKERANLPYSE